MEREFEIERQREIQKRTGEIHEAEERLLKAQEAAQQTIQVSERQASDAAALREEARFLGLRGLQPEVEAEARLLRAQKPPGATIERSREIQLPTPEQQELHRGAEAIAEKQAGGPHRPSWESAPEVPKRHLVPGTVLRETDDAIARSVGERDSRIQGRELTERDLRILKGDAGEGRTYVDLLDRYERDRIQHQPRFEDSDRTRNPDFVVISDEHSGKIAEIVDSKAWSLMRPRDGQGNPVSNEEFFRYLQQRPEAHALLNTQELQRVVEKYASSPRLEPDGKVVLYFPEDVIRYAPQVKQEIEGWSGTEIAHGRVVEVRSMDVWQQELWTDVYRRFGK